jgi:hypothetical protein
LDTWRKEVLKKSDIKRHKALNVEVDPGILPEDRIKDALFFEVSGVSLAGPLTIIGGQKAWIEVFTCAVYRALYLELITDLTTNGFLLSLRRFIVH